VPLFAAAAWLIALLVLGVIRHESRVGKQRPSIDYMLYVTNSPAHSRDSTKRTVAWMPVFVWAPDELRPGESTLITIDVERSRQVIASSVDVGSVYAALHDLEVLRDEPFMGSKDTKKDKSDIQDLKGQLSQALAGDVGDPGFRKITVNTLVGGGQVKLLRPSDFSRVTCKILKPEAFDGIAIPGTEGDLSAVCRWAIAPKAVGLEIIAYDLGVGRTHLYGWRTIDVEEAPWSLERLTAITGILTALVAIVLGWRKRNA